MGSTKMAKVKGAKKGKKAAEAEKSEPVDSVEPVDQDNENTEEAASTHNEEAPAKAPKKAAKGGKGDKKGKNKVETLDEVIDSKLNQKIKEQINEIQETINRLKDGQPIFANDAEIRLNHLNCSVSEMNVMAEELSKLRGTAGNLQVETELIYSKFDDTTVKISASLSKLQTKIADHAVEQSQMGNDLNTLKQKIEENQISLEYELAENQRKINEQLEELKETLKDAIEVSKTEAIKKSKCCTIL